MKNKIIFSLVLGIFLISLAYADISYCCEKTVNGAWCQNSPKENCDEGFRSTPASCEATSYCKLGTCMDSQEGTCMENSPQKVCEESGGVWKLGSADEIPQCSLGCCAIGDGAAFVTQTRCKRLSSIYSLKTDFRTDVASEFECISSAKSSVKGACVFESEYQRTCLLLSQAECSERGGTNESEFHEGYLCSDESLGTDCGPTEQTRCVENRDEVYFVDSCGNLANIYDASKIKDKNYWSKIYDKTQSCGTDSGNANSASCGNCDYYLGSMCKEYKRDADKVQPNYGNFICRDLSCNFDGKKYNHGETWCQNSEGVDKNLPGSRYFRAVCYNGEVSIEPCADFRQEICLESKVESFSAAGCIANKWQDCFSQSSQKDCENQDRRDCVWMEKVNLTGGNTSKGVQCVAKFAPGFKFWESGSQTQTSTTPTTTTGNASAGAGSNSSNFGAMPSQSQSLCSLADSKCTVQYEKKLFGSKKCVKNCECLDQKWQETQNEICVSIGDCGNSTNFIGVKGY